MCKRDKGVGGGMKGLWRIPTIRQRKECELSAGATKKVSGGQGAATRKVVFGDHKSDSCG